LIKVYKRTLFGEKLVGWQDDDGSTYKADWGRNHHPVHWTVDKKGRVYTLFENLSSLLGWVTADGVVWDKYGQPYGTWAPTASRGGAVVGRGFQPGLVFRIGEGGAIYGRGPFGTKLIGRVEGSSDIMHTGALALLLLRDYD
jgi:hypothetical protein